MSMYLHYWYKHYDDAETYLNKDYNAMKSRVLLEQLNNFKTLRKNDMIYATSDENADKALQILEDFGITADGTLGGIIQSKLENVEPMYTSSANSGFVMNGESYSYQQIGYAFGSDKPEAQKTASAIAQTIGDQLGEIISTAQSILDEIADTLRENYPRYWKYAKDNAKKITGDVGLGLTSGVQFIEWPTRYGIKPAKYLAQDYMRIKNRIEALKTFEGRESYSASDGQIIGKLVGKIGGSFSNAGGQCLEIVAKQVYNKSRSLMKQRLPEITGDNNAYTIAGVDGGDTGISIRKNLYMSQDLKNWLDEQNTKDAGTYNKNDVTIVYNSDGVIISFGMSVKNAKVDKVTGKVIGNIKLQDMSTLADVLEKVYNRGIPKNAVINIAGGLNRVIYEGESASSYIKKDDKRYRGDQTEKSLSQAWRDIVDYGVALNFLDFLVGDNTVGSNNLLMVINNKIYPMEEMIMQVVNAAASSEDGLGPIDYSGGKRRDVFYKKNIWVGKKVGEHRNPVQAAERSVTAISDIEQTFQQTKMTIKLQTSLMSLLG